MKDQHAYDRLVNHRETWQTKPVIREIYGRYFSLILSYLVEGQTLEIGSGCGNFKDMIKNVVTMDIVATPWLDITADAQCVPFKQDSFSNVVMIDVLHHIECPKKMLTEIARILKPGGRVVLLEPAITPGSWVFYKLFHPEPIDMSVDPFSENTSDNSRDPFDANQALPTLIFDVYQERLKNEIPELTMLHMSKMSLAVYPLSGGFRKWSIVPYRLVGPLLSCERMLNPYLGRICAFRIFVVLEKKSEVINTKGES